MGNSTKKGGVIGVAIAGLVVTVAVVIGGNALSSTSVGTVEGVIVKQWKDRRCKRRKRRARTCNTDYNSKIKLPDGKYRTIDSRNWYQQKKIGDIVPLDKRKGGWFGNIYYKPTKG